MPRLSLRSVLLLSGVGLTLFPLATVLIVMQRQNLITIAKAEESTNQLASDDLNHLMQNTLGMCDITSTVVQGRLDATLMQVASTTQQAGHFSLDSAKTVSWKAINQATQDAAECQLPQLMLGKTSLAQNDDPAVPSPLVDDITRTTGFTCTIFQRMNQRGDMLRVCTSVLRGGKRAVGTFIPAVDAAGLPTPAIKTVLAGGRFSGRAKVVDRWFLTAYEPILDAQSNVIGMLYVGLPEADATANLRKSLAKIQVGKSGYIFVLNALGDTRGHYVLSKGMASDGKDIWDSQDANGTPFIQDMCSRALKMAPGEVGEIRYPWKNQDDAVARAKTARFAYFKEWDWVLGVSAYDDEFHAAANQIRDSATHNLKLALLITGVAAAVSTGVWFLIARRLSRRINAVVSILGAEGAHINNASHEVATGSQSIAQGTSQQAASLEETTSALTEMASMTQKTADSARQARAIADQAQASVQRGNQAMDKMSTAIRDIEKSASETAGIIKNINEIAFQTNLLALNAAVEAARAGDAGKGFAVVAQEVRNLAIRSADAARNTTEMIDESIRNARHGVAIGQDVGNNLHQIAEATTMVSALVAEIATGAAEQSHGISQVNAAANEMSKSTQANAAAAEESASAAAEMSGNAARLHDTVLQLCQIVDGRAPASSPSSRVSRIPPK